MDLSDKIKVPVGTEDRSKMVEVEANVKDGLAIHKSVDLLRLDWVVMHAASGRYLFSVSTWDRAAMEREKLLALAIDWTGSEEEVLASKHRDAAATIIRNLMPRGTVPAIVAVPVTTRIPGF